MDSLDDRSLTATHDNARRLAVEVLRRIERDGAYANLALRVALDRSNMARRDRAFATELVYGTTRMRRACDYLVDRWLHDEVQPEVRTVLRIGAYQLAFGGVPPHAAVAATVAVAPRRVRGLCNAVLRRVARELESGPPAWPSPAVRLSCPDWLYDRLVADLGNDDAVRALEASNQSSTAIVREDGYYQDRASQLVVEVVLQNASNSGSAVTETGEFDGLRILDLCAAPGGKATAMAAAGAQLVASDIRAQRLKLVGDNADRMGLEMSLVLADGRDTPFRPRSFDRVLVDAPCSGLGVLRRRADARWREDPTTGGQGNDMVVRLAELQVSLMRSAAELVRPGGLVIYSVCTLTEAETTGVDRRFRMLRPDARPVAMASPWRAHGETGHGGLLLPQDLDSEGMAVFCYLVP